jgi:U3 small nucleolar RNA-associated protein 22
MNRLVLFIASNHDTTGTAFTSGGPSKVVAARMTALARSAWRVAQKDTLDLDIRNVFKPSLTDYDFIIYMSPSVTCDRSSGDRKQRQFKNIRLQENEDTSLLGYEQVQVFLTELESLYATSIVFFHDPSTRSVIAGIWNPQNACRPFKISMGFGMKPVKISNSKEGNQLVEIDKQAILADIARLGGDMITRIDTHP